MDGGVSMEGDRKKTSDRAPTEGFPSGPPRVEGATRVYFAVSITAAMAKAGKMAMLEFDHDYESHEDGARRVFEAMLAAYNEGDESEDDREVDRS